MFVFSASSDIPMPMMQDFDKVLNLGFSTMFVLYALVAGCGYVSCNPPSPHPMHSAKRLRVLTMCAISPKHSVIQILAHSQLPMGMPHHVQIPVWKRLVPCHKIEKKPKAG